MSYDGRLTCILPDLEHRFVALPPTEKACHELFFRLFDTYLARPRALCFQCLFVAYIVCVCVCVCVPVEPKLQ